MKREERRKGGQGRKESGNGRSPREERGEERDGKL